MNMEKTCFNLFPFQLDTQNLLKQLHLKPDSKPARELEPVFIEAEKLAKPKYCYAQSTLNWTDEDSFEIDGICFDGSWINKTFGKISTAYPFLATCGQELEQWSDTIDDIFLKFAADAIKESALSCTLNILKEKIKQEYAMKELGLLSPGSLETWPLEQQKPLFVFFEQESREIGVVLNDSCLMNPVKSLSGLMFAVDQPFESCQYCPRLDCSSRRAAYLYQ